LVLTLPKLQCSRLSSHARGGTDRSEGPIAQSLLGPLPGRDPVDEGEAHSRLGKLHRIHPAQFGRRDDGRPDDLDGTGTGPVPSRHLVVQLRHSPRQRDVPELPVHVVRPGPGRVPKPDPVVLHDPRVLLDDLDAVQDLTRRLLHLAELVHVVPELGLGDDRIGREDDHPVRFGIRVVVGRGLPADHLVLLHHAGDRHDTLRRIERRTEEKFGLVLAGNGRSSRGLCLQSFSRERIRGGATKSVSASGFSSEIRPECVLSVVYLTYLTFFYTCRLPASALREDRDD